MKCAQISQFIEKTSVSNTRKNSQPWFDKECVKTMNKMKKLSKRLKHSPANNIIHEELFLAKRNFKQVIRNKKQNYRTKLVEKMHLVHKKDVKQFWKILDKLDTQTPKESTSNYISADKWMKHFKTILKSKKPCPYPTHYEANGPLDYVISADEMMKASSILKPGKSPGYDCITNEMISATFSIYPLVFLNLFNHILKEGGCITSWSTSILVPIFKKGSPDDPSNYRGISLLSCLAKFFYSILNDRLLHFASENGILVPNQLGFLPGNRTSDAHIILHNLINKYCHKNRKYLYGCFIDFSKAFDSVPRDILFQKLIKYGITGKFLEVIMNAYREDHTFVKIKNKLSPKIMTEIGVKQGCIMSPMLFNLFMSDLPNTLGNENGVHLDKDTKINSLIWADDILLLSESEKGLKDSLKILHEFCGENELSINVDKTKCMIFNKTGRLIRRDFFIGDCKIENVREYKYLGLLFTPSGEIKSALDDLRSRALKAFWSLKYKLGTFFSTHIAETMNLFDVLIRPILTYASDFWGCLKLPKNNPIENVHTMFCKHILGVNKQTTSYGVWLELGKTPLMIFAQKAAIKNWVRIRRGDANHYLKLSYKNAQEDSLEWLSRIDLTLSAIGMGDIFRNDLGINTRTIPGIVSQRLTDIFHQEAFSTISNETSKLRTYSMVKSMSGVENYLSNVTNLKHRKSLSQLRLSSHRLMIEIGRHKRIVVKERFCPFCITVVEDEIHFVTKCKTYDTLRSPLFETCLTLKQNFNYYSDQEKFVFILTSDYLQIILAKFVYLAEELRLLLLQSPQNIDY